jgi:endoglucanase
VCRTHQRLSVADLGLRLTWLGLSVALGSGWVQSQEPPALDRTPLPPPRRAAPPGPVSPARWPSLLRAQGNRIVNGQGEVVRLQGLMIPDPARLVGEGRFTRSLFESMRTMGANVIRIPVHPQHWARDPDYLRRYLDPAVEWAGGLGMYVIVDWHSIGNAVTGYAPQSPESFCHTEAMTTDFWKRVAGHFKDTPHVIHEIFNEPQSISAADWRRCAGRLVGVIRAQGAGQLIIVGGLEYGRELDWVLQEPPAGENLAFASHIFPSHARSGWDHDFGGVASRYPVVITEWGFIDKQQPTNPSEAYLRGDVDTYGEPLIAYLNGRRIGWVACWFDEQWQPAMLLPDGKGYTRWGNFAAIQLKNRR